MKNEKELVGTLLGFDDYVNMVLEDVTEYEQTAEGRRVTKLEQILLNGSNITMLIPLLLQLIAQLTVKQTPTLRVMRLTPLPLLLLLVPARTITFCPSLLSRVSPFCGL